MNIKQLLLSLILLTISHNAYTANDDIEGNEIINIPCTNLLKKKLQCADLGQFSRSRVFRKMVIDFAGRTRDLKTLTTEIDLVIAEYYSERTEKYGHIENREDLNKKIIQVLSEKPVESLLKKPFHRRGKRNKSRY